MATGLRRKPFLRVTDEVDAKISALLISQSQIISSLSRSDLSREQLSVVKLRMPRKRVSRLDESDSQSQPGGIS